VYDPSGRGLQGSQDRKGTTSRLRRVGISDKKKSIDRSWQLP